MSAIFKAANTAVITGGASGIGLALAKKCAGYGMKVLVADWNTKLLDAVPKVVGENATTFHLDVSKLEDWAALKSKVESDFGGKISLLSLNAGIGTKSSFDDPDTSAFQSIIATNLFGVINGITTLLPVVKASATESSPSAIVITGSKQGITNPPGNPAYNASKAAVKSLAEHLSYDLRSTPINVHLLVPGWTWTGLAGGVAGAGRDDTSSTSSAEQPSSQPKKPDAPWWPEEVVDYLEQKMASGQFWVLCPDNEVTEETDRKRMLWTAGDAVNGRPPLSRWRNEFKGELADWMAKDI